MKFVHAVLLIMMLVPLTAFAQTDQTAENRRIAEIKAKRERGEQLTSEEMRFVQEVRSRQNQGKQEQAAAKKSQEYAKTHPPRDSVGFVPLTDLGKGTHKGEKGGLYPGGENVPPPAHLKAGVEIARRIVPVDGEGHAAENGRIVLLTVGISNTTLESQTFQQIATQDKDLNPRLVIVDGAQGMQPAQEAANPQAHYWEVVDRRLHAAGVTPEQVEVLWIKETYPGPNQAFPAEAKRLQGYLVDILRNAQNRFPSVKIAYLSSRIYAGYSAVGGNPEPWAYEFGFSVKWLIGDQIAGKPELNYDPARGQVRAPWLAWGPYLWADGVKGRKDGLVWLREDLAEDGMHPSTAGREKVARLLLDFLKNDATSRSWFVKSP
jgi:hypothetical protein